MIDASSESEAIVDWKAGDILAGDRLLRMHEGLIKFAVRRHVTDRSEIDDLMQVGRLAMLRAATQYDPALGRLATYAIGKIRAAARRHAMRSRCSFRLSHELRDSKEFDLYEARLDAPILSVVGARNLTLHDYLATPVADEIGVDVMAMVDVLPKRERDVLSRLYGHEPETLEQIATSRGVTKQAVHWLKGRALARLREAATART